MNKNEILYLDIAIEQINGKSFSVYLDKPFLMINVRNGNDIFEKVNEQKIEKPNWDYFITFLEKMNIWKLEKQYGSELIAKLWWNINIQTSRNKIVTCGINIMPDFKIPEESFFYKELSIAINKLSKRNVL